MKAKWICRGFAILLSVCMIFSILPAGLVSADENPTSITVDPNAKTVRIQGDLSSLGTSRVSVLIMDPSFGGNTENLLDNPALVALEQATLENGNLDITIALTTIIEGNYTIFINGTSVTKIFTFDSHYKYTVKAGETVTVPITLEDCVKLAGLQGTIKYDESLLTLESIAGKSGFILQQLSADTFMALSNTGMGVDGTVVIGYAIFTAIEDISDDVTTYVTFPKDKLTVMNEDLEEIEQTIETIEITILAEPPMPGDVNLDGKVDIADAILLLQYISGNVELSAKQLKAADVSSDGNVNVADVILIMHMCL